MSMTEPKLSLRIAERIDDRGDIIQLMLTEAGGGNLPSFEAGAHLEVEIPSEEGTLVRQYSLCGAPSEPNCYRLGILKDSKSRGGSLALHALAQEGTVLSASSPKNLFPLDKTAKRSLLFGGGIGITPVLSMASSLFEAGSDFEVHYCTRSVERTAFLTQIAAAPYAPNVCFHHDDDGTALDASAVPAFTPDTHIYVCGPEGFMDFVISQAEKAGFPAANIHREYFSADVVLSGEAFEVEARASGITISVGPEDTIAKALARAGVKVDVKCEEGICGTCITEIIEGEADHRDKFLTPEEQEENFEMALCCSRAKGKKIVIDI